MLVTGNLEVLLKEDTFLSCKDFRPRFLGILPTGLLHTHRLTQTHTEIHANTYI